MAVLRAKSTPGKHLSLWMEEILDEVDEVEQETLQREGAGNTKHAIQGFPSIPRLMTGCGSIQAALVSFV